MKLSVLGALKAVIGFGLLLPLAACAHAPTRAPLKANDQYGWVYDSPTAVQGPRVIVVPQWHLSPQTNTVYSSDSLPQAENQQAIFRQLVEWVESSQVQTVVVEGCEGEIDRGFATRFNGWGLEDLEKLTAEELDHVVTNVGLKIKAKVGAKARVVCGDSLKLIKTHQLILSDMRGLLGFKVRIEQFKDQPSQRTDYLASVRDLLKLPKAASDTDILANLDDQLRAKLLEFNQILHERNESFVRTAKFASPTAAVVIGAIHVEDLEAQFKKQNLATSTFEPRGLKGDESELLKQIDTMLSAQAAAPASTPVQPPLPAK